MSDVTIPAETAKRIAGVLRMHADTVPTGSAAATQWGALADLLDPGEQPKPVCQWGECALVAEKRAVAALLRAVADMCSGTLELLPAELDVIAAAHALAEAILGEEK